MKTTLYFDFTRKRRDRSGIQNEWIETAIADPVEEEVQTDGRIRRWTWVEEESKFLRIVLLEDGETVHNAFFDRGFKRKENS